MGCHHLLRVLPALSLNIHLEMLVFQSSASRQPDEGAGEGAEQLFWVLLSPKYVQSSHPPTQRKCLSPQPGSCAHPGSPSASTWPQGRPQVLASHPGAWTQAVHCPERKGYLPDQSQAPEASPGSRGVWGIHQHPPQRACGPMAFPSVPESLVRPRCTRIPGRLAAMCPLSMSV